MEQMINDRLKELKEEHAKTIEEHSKLSKHLEQLSERAIYLIGSHNELEETMKNILEKLKQDEDISKKK